MLRFDSEPVLVNRLGKRKNAIFRLFFIVVYRRHAILDTWWLLLKWLILGFWFVDLRLQLAVLRLKPRVNVLILVLVGLAHIVVFPKDSLILFFSGRFEEGFLAAFFGCTQNPNCLFWLLLWFNVKNTARLFWIFGSKLIRYLSPVRIPRSFEPTRDTLIPMHALDNFTSNITRLPLLFSLPPCCQLFLLFRFNQPAL